jgi:putative tryptophan/tyrosine transport system substrate-binding protein
VREIKRRELITLLGGAAALWPSLAAAQRPHRPARLGILIYSNPQADTTSAPLRDGLRDLGYIEGQNLLIEYRYAEGKPERLPALAAELVRLQPDVLLAAGGDVAPFAVKATQTIPIVFIMSADPQQLGMIASLARPGGNATGVSFLMDEIASKRLGLLKEAAPRISKVAFLWNPDHADNEQREAQRAASALGVQLTPIAVRGAGDLDNTFEAIAQARADALYVVSSRHTVASLPRIVDFATRNQLPLAGGWGAWAKAGGLLSYGPNTADMTRRAAGYVDRILKGARPAELPVQLPERFELFINLKAAKAVGLEVSPTLLARADEVLD